MTVSMLPGVRKGLPGNCGTPTSGLFGVSEYLLREGGRLREWQLKPVLIDATVGCETLGNETAL